MVMVAPTGEQEEPSQMLPPADLEPGVLPTEIRKLVDSRRQVKQLMKYPGVSQEQLTQVQTPLTRYYEEL